MKPITPELLALYALEAGLDDNTQRAVEAHLKTHPEDLRLVQEYRAIDWALKQPVPILSNSPTLPATIHSTNGHSNHLMELSAMPHVLELESRNRRTISLRPSRPKRMVMAVAASITLGALAFAGVEKLVTSRQDDQKQLLTVTGDPSKQPPTVVQGPAANASKNPAVATTPQQEERPLPIEREASQPKTPTVVAAPRQPAQANDNRLMPGREASSSKAVTLATAGRVSPVAPAAYGMLLNGHDIPLFNADEPGANPARRSVVYTAPIRVADEPRFDPKSSEVLVTIDMTAPPEVREETSKRVAAFLSEEGATPPKVIVQPLPIRSYTVELIADDVEGALRIGSAGDSKTAMILATDSITFKAVVPATMPILRDTLRRSPHVVRIQLRAIYDFERVVKGSVSLARAGSAIHKVLEEVRPKFPEGRISPDLLLNRQALDRVLAQLGDSIERTESSSGLSEEAFSSLVADTRESLKEYFAALPHRNAYELMTRDTNEIALVYTAPNGQLEAKPILSRDKITFKEKSEEYTRKATDDLKVVQDIARKGAFSRETHKELRDKLSINGNMSMGIGIFSASASLKLDKSSEQINDDDLKTMNDNRDYWNNDSKRTEEIATRVHEKVAGEMNLEKYIPKTIDLYRLDERELTNRVEARVSRTLSQGFEGLGLLSETNLVVRPDERIKNLQSQLSAAQKKLESLEADRVVNEKAIASCKGGQQELMQRLDALDSAFKLASKSGLKVAQSEFMLVNEDSPYQKGKYEGEVVRVPNNIPIDWSPAQQWGTQVVAVWPIQVDNPNCSSAFSQMYPSVSGNRVRFWFSGSKEKTAAKIFYYVLYKE